MTDLNLKVSQDGPVLFALSARFCTCWYYPQYFICF